MLDVNKLIQNDAVMETIFQNLDTFDAETIKELEDYYEKNFKKINENFFGVMYTKRMFLFLIRNTVNPKDFEYSRIRDLTGIDRFTDEESKLIYETIIIHRNDYNLYTDKKIKDALFPYMSDKYRKIIYDDIRSNIKDIDELINFENVLELYKISVSKDEVLNLFEKYFTHTKSHYYMHTLKKIYQKLEISSEIIEELYTMYTSSVLRGIILSHPNTPKKFFDKLNTTYKNLNLIKGLLKSPSCPTSILLEYSLSKNKVLQKIAKDQLNGRKVNE